MKIAIECKSPLLQKSLENFLHEHLSSSHSCDLLLSDKKFENKKNILRIGSDKEADIIKPFSKAQLFLKLEQFFRAKEESNVAISETKESKNKQIKRGQSNDISKLEEKIERLTNSYVHGVMSLIREYHDKK